jgi:hypothetical protein
VASCHKMWQLEGGLREGVATRGGWPGGRVFGPEPALSGAGSPVRVASCHKMWQLEVELREGVATRGGGGLGSGGREGLEGRGGGGLGSGGREDLEARLGGCAAG